MAPPTPPHPPFPSPSGNIGDRKRKRIADDGASPSYHPPAALLPPQNMSTQVTDAAVTAIADKVGDLVGTLWDYSFGLVANIIFLSRKADEVAEEMGKLQSFRDDLMRRAEDDVRQTRANVSNQLEWWVSRVSSLADDAAKFQRSFEDRSTFVTRFRLGYDAVELLKRARKLAEEGNLFSGGAPLTCPRGPDPVEQVPSETTRSTIVGGREDLQQVEGYIMDDGVGIIGIYGMVAEEMEKLQSLRDDLMHRAVTEARQNQANVSNQLSGWTSRVMSLAEDAAKFQRSFEDRSTCNTRFRLEYDAVELLKQVRKLAKEGNLFSGSLLICPREPDPVEQVPSETSSSTLAGGREALERVQNHIMDDRVGIIGIYGMGGVGKTTLLKIINNEFLKGETCSDKFDVAIWVTVSRDVQISSIRETVAGRLGLPSGTTKEQLFRHLSEKRFILFLDDVWEKLDLTEIGIPRPRISNKSKILFTTRKEEICGEMDFDHKEKIKSLDDKNSWELFRSKFGREAAVLDDPSIRPLAEQVVERCGGLPIALITVGKAMSNAKTTYEWTDAIRKLDQCAAELSGMEAVLKSLKFSFDMLKDDALRNCLLYCALFPEDFKIAKEKIIDYWICEGFLDPEDFEEDNIEDTRCRGNVRISELQNACLLEETLIDTDGRGCVNLHDTVRDMALWIARNDFVVLSGSSNVNNAFSSASSSHLVPKSSFWENAIRISLMYNRNIKEPPSSSYPNLTTLLLQSFYVHSREIFSKGFLRFTSMPLLRVLDLDGTSLSEFPIEITSLTSLQYLGLKSNNFSSLPVELGNLTDLRILILTSTRSLTSIPVEAISHLSCLQVLDMLGSSYQFGDFNTHRHLQQLELSDLANLKRLFELYLPDLCSWASLEKIAASPVLQRSTRGLAIKVSISPSPPPIGDTISEQIDRLSALRSLELCPNPSDPVMGELQLYSISRLQNLKYLYISHFREAKLSINNISSHGLEPLFPRLQQLLILHCHGCSELTWVGRLPCLEKLEVTDCEGLREIMMPLDGGGSTSTSFPMLKIMCLRDLPSLRSISTSTLLFPCLEQLKVYECPLLQRLPFGPQSAKNLHIINGQKAWWDGLEWDDDSLQQSFSSKYGGTGWRYSMYGTAKG